MTRTPLLLALLLALAALPAAAADRLAFHEKTLDNGMRVVVHEDKSCPIVAVQVWYHVGSKDEDPARQGFAHMFEHMMFRGTDRLGPEDHFEFIRGSGGNCNAYTSFDQTVYVQTVPKNQLPMVLWLEAERMSALKVDEEGFATERAVVEEEARMGMNRPYGTLMEKLLEEIFTVHPYQWSPIGKIDHLRAATSEELLRFWETYYVPNNATLVVVGDVDHEEVFGQAKEAFGWIPRCADPPRVHVEEPLRDAPLVIELEEKKGPVPIVAAAYRTVSQGHDDALALEMVMQILGGGESSRLYRKIVDEEEKAPMAMAGAFALEQTGIAAAGAMTMPFGDIDGVLELIDDELALLKADGVTEEELGKAKASFRRSLVDATMTVESKAQQIGTAAVFHGSPDWLNRRAEQIEEVSLDDLNRVARTYLVPERRITVKVEPTLGGMMSTLLGGLLGKKDEDAADEHDHDHEKEVAATSTMAERRGPKATARRPEGAPEAPPVAPLLGARVPFDAVERRLDNGLTVAVVENHEVPLVFMQLGLLNGAFLDPADRPGAAVMASQMLTKGTRAYDAQRLAEELESNAIRLGAGADMDSASVSGSATSNQLGRLAQLFAEVVKYPTFPEGEFRKLVRQAKTGKSIEEKSPDAIAEREFRRALFGAHFYARTADGTSDDLDELRVTDAASWWRRAARPDQAVLFFAGDVDAEVAFELAEAFFGDWTVPGEPPRAAVAELPEKEETRIVLIDVPGAIQSQIRVGHRGITRGDPRWFGGRVMSQIFGGAFNARLNQVIRVEKGLTYGARGGLSADRFAGRFYVSTFSKTATTVEAVAAILGEVERIRDEAPTPDELGQAKSYTVGSFAGNHETPNSIVAELWSTRLNGLPADFATRYLDAVAKVTSEEVQRIAREIVDPEHLVIVVVGDAASVMDGLEAIAPVTLLGEDGSPKVLEEVEFEEIEEDEVEDGEFAGSGG